MAAKAWRIAGIAIAVLVTAVIGCEVAGWPFLVKPAERTLSRVLAREVRLSGADGRASMHFLGGIRVSAPALQIGAPAWSQKPFLLRAEGADTRLAYGALWRAYRGGPVHIDRLHAENLIVHAQRRADGQASWTFGDPAQPRQDSGRGLPTIGELSVRKGELSYVDVPLRIDMAADIELSEGASSRQDGTPAPDSLRVKAQGTYADASISARLVAAGATGLLAPDNTQPATPVLLEVQAGRSAFMFRGKVSDVLKLRGMTGAVRMSGSSLAVAADPFGVTLPSTGPFEVAGYVTKAGDLWKMTTAAATVGTSTLQAALTYDLRRKVPLLAGRVSGPRLLLADLAPAVSGQASAPHAPPKAAKPASSRVLPDREFDLPSLRAMDANVLLAFDRVELGDAFALPLQPLKAHLTLQQGKLFIGDLDARTADGSLAGSLGFDGTDKEALWRTDLRLSGVRMERWLKQDRGGDAPPYISGRLAARAALQGRGRSTAQILASLDGTVTATLQNGQLSHLVVEAAGIDLAQALGVLVKGDEPLAVNCAVADLQAERGVLRSRAFVVDTADSVVWVDGSVSLLDESLDLRAVVNPKDFSPLALRTPVHVTGSFSQPDISLEKAPLARKLAAGALLALINPLAAIIPMIDTGEGEDKAGCPELLSRARRSSAASAKGG